MAKQEVNTYLGSSQNNFLVFDNDNFEKPFVTFYFRSGENPVGLIKISDALDEDGYSKTIRYSPSETITDTSFKCVSDRTLNIFSFLECLKKNPIFYDITLISDIPNVGILIKAYIDSSTRYNISAGSILVVGGTYSSWVPREPNKFILLENTSSNQVFLEKYTMAEDVSFNVTAPYEHLSFKDPISVKLMAYHLSDNAVVTDNIANNNVKVFPTTLSKFDDTNLGDYLDNGFLTHNLNRSYNYGELCGLSVMTNGSPTLTKKYYTNGGLHLMSDTNYLYKEDNESRVDFYFKLDLETAESVTNKQVGYVEVSCGSGKPIIYTVEAKCNQNNEIFFVNEIGGIDSFNFLGEREFEGKIKNQSTYMMNPTRKFDKVKEIECIGQQIDEIKHTLTSSIIDSDTALWLNEMKKTKYPFKFVNGIPTKFERIVITEMNISVTDRDNVFEVQMTYQDGDNNISL